MQTIDELRALLSEASNQLAWESQRRNEAEERAEKARKAMDYWHDRARAAERAEQETACEHMALLVLHETMHANPERHRRRLALVRAIGRHLDQPGSADAELRALRDELIGVYVGPDATEGCAAGEPPAEE